MQEYDPSGRLEPKSLLLSRYFKSPTLLHQALGSWEFEYDKSFARWASIRQILAHKNIRLQSLEASGLKEPQNKYLNIESFLTFIPTFVSFG